MSSNVLIVNQELQTGDLAYKHNWNAWVEANDAAAGAFPEGPSWSFWRAVRENFLEAGGVRIQDLPDFEQAKYWQVGS